MTEEPAAAAAAKPAPRRGAPDEVTFERRPDALPLVQACEFALGLLKHTRTRSLADFSTKALDLSNRDLDITFRRYFAGLDPDRDSDRLALLETYEPILRHICPSSPIITLAVCPECYSEAYDHDGSLVSVHGWMVVDSFKPKKCMITAGCQGIPERVGPAKKIAWKAGTEQPKPVETTAAEDFS